MVKRHYEPIQSLNLENQVSTWFGLTWSSKLVSDKISYRTPDYRALLAAGLPLPQHDFLWRRTINSDVPGNYTQWYWGEVSPGKYAPYPYAPKVMCMHSIFGYPAAWSGWTSLKADARNRAQRKVIDRLKNQKVNLGQFIGEFGQARKMFTSTASKIANAALQLKRFNVRGALKALTYEVDHETYRRLVSSARDAKIKGKSGARYLADNWLQYQYGWKPLLQDTFGACELAYDGIKSGGIIHTASALSRAAADERITPHNDDSSTLWHKYSWRVEARYNIRYRVTNPGLMTSSSLGLLNPLSLAWELLPYSFVVDWFVDVGSFLNNLDATSGLEFDSGSYSTNVSVIQEWAFRGKGPYRTASNPYPGDMVSGNLILKQRLREKERKIISSFPIQEIEFGSGLTGVRQGNALALVTQQLDRIFSKGRR